MSYTIKILRIAENRSWQPPPDQPDSGAGPNIPGAWLAKNVIIEVTPKGAHGKRPGHADTPLKITEPEIYELLVPCKDGDVTEAAIKEALKERIGRLPVKHPLENKEVTID